jgi:hypothetical protein
MKKDRFYNLKLLALILFGFSIGPGIVLLTIYADGIDAFATKIVTLILK